VAQDQVLHTKYQATKLLQTGTVNKCRICKQFYETVEQIILACPVMPKEQPVKRHERVLAQLHFNTSTEKGRN
jgi:hypothetical protein